MPLDIIIQFVERNMSTQEFSKHLHENFYDTISKRAFKLFCPLYKG